jgi:hypothetical protein
MGTGCDVRVTGKAAVCGVGGIDCGAGAVKDRPRAMVDGSYHTVLFEIPCLGLETLDMVDRDVG